MCAKLRPCKACAGSAREVASQVRVHLQDALQLSMEKKRRIVENRRQLLLNLEQLLRKRNMVRTQLEAHITAYAIAWHAERLWAMSWQDLLILVLGHMSMLHRHCRWWIFCRTACPCGTMTCQPRRPS